jgi:hypothetical protein
VSPHALPSWFGDLRGFFPVAAQILAGLIVAVVFARRELRYPVAEQLLRSATPIAMAGVLASVIGTLPHLRPGLQGFLLGYVCAGYVCVLTALGLLAAGTLEATGRSTG